MANVKNIKAQIWMALSSTQQTKVCRNRTVETMGSFEDDFKFFQNVLRATSNKAILKQAQAGLKAL